MNNFCTWKDYKREINKPLAEKIKDTQAIIEERLWEFGNKCYVAWSGGKDSTLVLHFALQELPGIPVLHANTGVEYPETVQYIKEITAGWNLNLTVTKPLKSFWRCVDEYGWPGFRGKDKENKGTPQCCNYLKEYPAREIVKKNGYEAVMLGLTGPESRQRRLLFIQYGYCYFVKKDNIQKINPIWHWKEQEVLNYFKNNALPLNPIYDKIKRCGCMPCTGFIGARKQLGRANPKMAQLVAKKKGNTLLDSFS